MSVWSELVTWWERALGIIGAGVRGRRDIMIRQTLAPAQLSEHLRPRNLCSAPNFDTAAKFSLNSESICDIWSPPTERDCNPNIWSFACERQQQILSEKSDLSVCENSECYSKTNLHSDYSLIEPGVVTGFQYIRIGKRANEHKNGFITS